MSQPIQILLNGAKGRMGLAIANVAADEKAVIAAGVDQGDNLAAHISAGDVVIDFSFQSATLAVAQLCAQHKKPLVIGTTGHTAEEKAAITAAITAAMPPPTTTISMGSPRSATGVEKFIGSRDLKTAWALPVEGKEALRDGKM